MSHEMTHTAKNSPYTDFAFGNLGGCKRPILPLKIVLRRGNKIKDLMKRPIDVCIQVETDHHNFLWGETNFRGVLWQRGGLFGSSIRAGFWIEGDKIPR